MALMTVPLGRTSAHLGNGRHNQGSLSARDVHNSGDHVPVTGAPAGVPERAACRAGQHELGNI